MSGEKVLDVCRSYGRHIIFCFYGVFGFRVLVGVWGRGVWGTRWILRGCLLSGYFVDVILMT